MKDKPVNSVDNWVGQSFLVISMRRQIYRFENSSLNISFNQVLVDARGRLMASSHPRIMFAFGYEHFFRFSISNARGIY